MTALTASQLYSNFVAAGYTPASAVIQTAIALAESKGDNAALGDVKLQDDKWGPSYGYSQIRTLKADTGRGTTRDIAWLAESDINQAKASYDVSNHGRDFSPWTMYRNGEYKDYLGQAQAAAAGGGTPVQTVGDKGPFPTWGPEWLPWNWPSNSGNAIVQQGLSGARTIAVEAAFVGLGIGLVYIGVMQGIAPKVAGKLKDAASVAAIVV